MDSFSKGGKGSGIRGHKTYHGEMIQVGLKNLTPELKERLKEIREGKEDSEEQKEQFIEDVLLLGIESSKKGKQKKERSKEQQELLNKIKQNKEERLAEKIKSLEVLSDGKVKEKEIRESLTKISESKNKEETFKEEKKKLKDKVPKNKVSKWEKEFKSFIGNFAKEIFQTSKEMERDVKKSFSKGGPGSGVKGHKTFKEKYKDLKDFFGTPENYEIFESQGGLEILDKMFEIFGENTTKDVLAKTTLSFDDERIQTGAVGEVCFSLSGEASLRLKNKTALFGTIHKQKKYIAAHEIGHIAFTNFQLRDSSSLNDSLSEGLAILFSNSLVPSGWENNEYKKHAIQTFNLLKDFSEQEGETIQRSFKSISNLFIDESKIDKNIDKFLKFADKAKIKPLGSISKEFKDVIKEFRNGEI